MKPLNRSRSCQKVAAAGWDAKPCSEPFRRALTRFNPAFAAVNAVRDFGMGSVAVVDELGFKGQAQFTKDYAGALAASFRNERGTLSQGNAEWQRWFEEYPAAVGTMGGYYGRSTEDNVGDIRDLMLINGAAPKGKIELLKAKIADCEKERNFIIMLSPGVKMDVAKQVGKHGRYIKIPMPYGFNFFPMQGQNMADVLRHSKDETKGLTIGKAATNLLNNVLGSFNPISMGIDFNNKDSVLMAIPGWTRRM